MKPTNNELSLVHTIPNARNSYGLGDSCYLVPGDGENNFYVSGDGDYWIPRDLSISSLEHYSCFSVFRTNSNWEYMTKERINKWFVYEATLKDNR